MVGRRGLVVFCLLILCLVGQAQSDTWQAWLYDSGVGDLTLIDGQGFIREQAKLPLTRNMSSFPYNVAVSASGTRIAYVLGDGQRDELIVYDPRPGFREIVLQYALPQIASETLRESSNVGQFFSPDERRLAFGYAHQAGGWEIVLIDIQTGQAMLVLRSGAGVAANLSAEVGMTPVVRSFDGVRVAFTLMPSSGIGSISAYWESYLWDTQTNTIQSAPAYGTLDSDLFPPTGEIVQSLSDEPPRIVLFSSLSASEPLILSSAPETLPIFPRFVQNGMAVLYTVFDKQRRPTYELLRRGDTQPTSWDAGSAHIIGSLRGTATGFAYTVDTTNPDDSNFTTLYHVDTVNELGEGVPLFIAPTESRPRIIWLDDPRFTPAPAWESAVLPVATQDIYTQVDTWQTWIYQDNGIAMQLDEQGKTLDLEAIPPENALEGIVNSDILRPIRLSASPDGNWLVYALVVNDSLYVQVYDAVQNRVLMTHRIDGTEGSRPPHTLERAPHNLLNESQTALAFGYGGEGWQIDILDVGSGSVITSLAQESPAMRSLITETAFGVVPVIQSFAEGNVHFTIQGGGALTPPYPAFVWDTVLNTVDPTLLYVNPMTDTFAPTGEVLMAMIDARLPNTADRFLYGQLNTLHVYDPTTGTRTPFYNAPDLWLQKPIFIQNGERILSGGVDATGAFEGWSVLERDGEVAGVLPLMDDLVDAAGTGSGFIYIPRGEAGDTLALYAVNTHQALDAGQLILSIPRTGRPQIVWTSYPTQPVSYRPWRSLAVPIDVGDVSLLETPQPLTELVVGSEAVVRTTGGDALYLRDAAGLDGSVLTRLNSGTRVTIIRGPATEDGQDWWQILTPGGVSGWVVDEADGIKTLTPDN